MKPYCGERSISFLCDYVDSWNYMLDTIIYTNNKYYAETPVNLNLDIIKEFVLKMTLVKQALDDLTK
jgi:hypothetical protein